MSVKCNLHVTKCKSINQATEVFKASLFYVCLIFLVVSAVLISILFVLFIELSTNADSKNIVYLIKSIHNNDSIRNKGLLSLTAQLKNLDGEQRTRVSDEQSKIVSCYYNTPDAQAKNALLPSNVHPHLCTHINIAFATVENKTLKLTNSQYFALKEIVKLKKVNPNLKILVSVGGAQNDSGFPEMVIDHASRKMFIKSLKILLHNYSLDGIDLDWEFPAVHSNQYQLENKRERQHFSQLLHEIRSEFIKEKRDYLLSVAVAAQQTIVDVAYDVDQLNLYADYVNIMTYDYHVYSKMTPFTGLNSPLYRRFNEEDFWATLNINYTVHMYEQKGLARSKIVVGIPTYGHTFNLVNSKNTRVGSPASGFGSLGSFVNYPDICMFLRKFNDAIIEQDEDAKVPFLHRNQEWVSYESLASVAAKADFIKSLGLRGAMIYSLNADDFAGVCRGERAGGLRFPLLQSVRRSLDGNHSADATAEVGISTERATHSEKRHLN